MRGFGSGSHIDRNMYQSEEWMNGEVDIEAFEK
jgi:hypothetical protein